MMEHRAGVFVNRD